MFDNSKLSPLRLVTLLTLTVALVAGLGAGRASAQEKEKEKEKEKPAISRSLGDDTINPNQPIKTDFIINVSVVGEPDPSGNYPVDASGNVAIRYGGIMTPVSVKGLTPAQAADAIAKFLKTYVKQPQVTVSIVSVPRPVVFIFGAVRNSGPLNIPPDTTLVDVLSKAEWSENADLSAVRITRKVAGQDKPEIITVKFDRYLKVGPGETPDESQNPVLKDKDRILVPSRTLPGNGVVSVSGEVTKPSISIPLRTNPPMTVREVINLVGGTTPGANRKAVSIRRPTVDRPLVIDLEKAEQGDLVNNIEIKPDDVIYVEKLENNAYVNVNGGFVKPGKFIYDKRTTLSQVVMEAGGAAPYSKLNEGRILRHPDNDPKNFRVIAFNWKDIQNGKAQDIELQPGDSVWLTPGQPSTRPPIDLFNGISLALQASYLYNTLFGGSNVNSGFPFFGGIR